MTRNQIRSKVRRTINKANKIWNLTLPYPTVEFFERGMWAGWAHSPSNTIAFNEQIASINGSDFSPIVIHEVAHLVTDKMFPKARRSHGKEFFVVDRALGGAGFTHHELLTNDDL